MPQSLVYNYIHIINSLHSARSAQNEGYLLAVVIFIFSSHFSIANKNKER